MCKVVGFCGVNGEVVDGVGGGGGSVVVKDEVVGG